MSNVNELLNYFDVNKKNNLIKENEQKEKIIVKRYFPGKKPHYAKNREDDDDDDDDEDEFDEYDELLFHEETKKEENKNTEIKNEEILQNDNNNNIYKYETFNKFEEFEKNNKIIGNKEERLKRRVREVVVVNSNELNDIKQKDKDDILIINNFLDNNYLNKNDNELEDKDEDKDEEKDEEKDNEEDNEEESDDNYNSDDSYLKSDQSDEETNNKHYFISKKERKTIIEKKNKEEKEKIMNENLKKENNLIEQEKKENAIKEVLLEEKRQEELKTKENNLYSSEEDFEEEEEEYDEQTNEKEYELWKIREMKRFKRDELERKKYEILQEEIKKRRKMTDKEIIEDNKNSKNKMKKKKTKMLFLQKYYHKGGFYQDLFEEGKEEIYLRDYNEPTYEDKINKLALPKVLRVRRGNFGKRGRTKYTHLLDNDTSQIDSLWKESEFNLQKKKKKNQFDRPTYKKK